MNIWRKPPVDDIKFAFDLQRERAARESSGIDLDQRLRDIDQIEARFRTAHGEPFDRMRRRPTLGVWVGVAIGVYLLSTATLGRAVFDLSFHDFGFVCFVAMVPVFVGVIVVARRLLKPRA